MNSLSHPPAWRPWAGAVLLLLASLLIAACAGHQWASPADLLAALGGEDSLRSRLLLQLVPAAATCPAAAGLMLLLLAWRTGVGGLNAFQSQTTTMMLGFPEWVVYLLMVPALALTALIALAQGLVGFGRLEKIADAPPAGGPI